VLAPTLLIVGERDTPVIAMNEAALERLEYVKRLEIVTGATHLFEEPGALEQVARIARDWFERYLAPTSETAAAVHRSDELDAVELG
jgi:pimeloyl-ACP methyl ester carboxylesterase